MSETVDKETLQDLWASLGLSDAAVEHAEDIVRLMELRQPFTDAALKRLVVQSIATKAEMLMLRAKIEVSQQFRQELQP